MIGFIQMQNLVLFQKTYDFILWMYPCINRIPKSHRHVLGRYLENTCLQILIHIIEANNLRGDCRVKLQKEISSNLDKIRILIRLCKDLRFISTKQYAFAAEKLNEIARIHKAWVKVS